MELQIFMVQIMVPYNYTEFIDILTNLVEKNYIPMSRIDDAVARILRVKFVAGLFEDPYADLSLADHIGSKVGKINNWLLLLTLSIGEYITNSGFQD